ncbi:uncharacterized protein LOC120327213 [Styela clava]
MASRDFANDVEAKEKSEYVVMEPNKIGQHTYAEVSGGRMPTASNDGFYLDFAQTTAGDAAAESHGRELNATKNVVTNLKNQTSKLSRNVVRQKKCLILITITFVVLLAMGLATVYMLTQNKKTQPFGNVENKTLANLAQYIDKQRKEINLLELRFREVQANLSSKIFKKHEISEGDLKQVNKIAQPQTATNKLKSAQECLIKNAVMEAGENYTTVDGKLLWTVTAPELNYTMAYNVCASYWSTMAQIKSQREYDSVMSMLRPKSKYITVWTGLEINPMTGQISPTDGFTQWYGIEPGIGSSYKTYTKVSLVVHSDPKYGRQGMMNAEPNWWRDKVLCQL